MHHVEQPLVVICVACVSRLHLDYSCALGVSEGEYIVSFWINITLERNREVIG